MDNINFPKILPALSATAGVKRVKRRKDQNQRQPFQRALQQENEKKNKQQEEEQPGDSQESIDTEPLDGTGPGKQDDDPENSNFTDRNKGQRQSGDEYSPKKLIDVHV